MSRREYAPNEIFKDRSVIKHMVAMIIKLASILVGLFSVLSTSSMIFAVGRYIIIQRKNTYRISIMVKNENTQSIKVATEANTRLLSFIAVVWSSFIFCIASKAGMNAMKKGDMFPRL